jgi:putative ABC transport system ATP-binding protein
VILRAIGVEKEFETPAGVIPVLRGVDLCLEAGQSLAILGASGSGKSTLLSLLAGLGAPTRGRIEVEGQDLAALGERALAGFRARRLSIVFQQFHLLGSLSALENVRLPLDLQRELDAEQRARDALAQVGLLERAAHLPSRLSGGECQRVAIARALVAAPALLLADEPSGSLDAQTGAGVVKLLFAQVERRRTALVLVTHSEALAQRCQRRVHLVAGRLEPAA